MNFIPEDRVLEFKPDILQYVRKQYNLEKPGQMEEAINLLRDWVQKQSHFKRKDIYERYYEICIIACKGSIERAKRQIDKMCTMRTVLPQFFGAYNVKTDLGNIEEMTYSVVLPKLTDDYNRVCVSKFNDVILKYYDYMDFFRYFIIISEYIKAHDYISGFIFIIDFSDANLIDYVKKANLVELSQIFTIIIEGYGVRLKSIDVITTSKFVDVFLLLLKQALSPKLAERIKVHKTYTEIYETVPKSILPKDYGGEERSLKELQAVWSEALSSEENLKYLYEINQFCTDETCRQKYKFNEEYAGMPGTFRLLKID